MTYPMTGRRTTLIGTLSLAAAASLLAGCISLFPEAEPVQLYRFGTAAPQLQQTASTAEDFTVALAVTGFERAAARDRILTFTGMQAAYIKGARWVTPAAALFESAVQAAFEADPRGPARLVAPGDAASSDYVLKLDVRNFEARYDNGQSAAPTIVVAVRAALYRADDRVFAGSRVFRAAVGAGDNRVGAIVSAFDEAVSQVLGQLVAWTDTGGRPA